MYRAENVSAGIEHRLNYCYALLIVNRSRKMLTYTYHPVSSRCNRFLQKWQLVMADRDSFPLGVTVHKINLQC